MANELKSCDPNIRSKLAQSGCQLTPVQEHQLAEAMHSNPELASFDWPSLLGLLGKLFPNLSGILSILLALLPHPASGTAAGTAPAPAPPAPPTSAADQQIAEQEQPGRPTPPPPAPPVHP